MRRGPVCGAWVRWSIVDFTKTPASASTVLASTNNLQRTYAIIKSCGPSWKQTTLSSGNRGQLLSVLNLMGSVLPVGWGRATAVTMRLSSMAFKQCPFLFDGESCDWGQFLNHNYSGSIFISTETREAAFTTSSCADNLQRYSAFHPLM